MTIRASRRGHAVRAWSRRPSAVGADNDQQIGSFPPGVHASDDLILTYDEVCASVREIVSAGVIGPRQAQALDEVTIPFWRSRGQQGR
ncbi:MAG TPA: hypothetical protein VEQ11_20585 [Chloroflexota bacterium]|nr:hypothetical protein [Chloroflexota bacterium]